jgi:acyl dehydratase
LPGVHSIWSGSLYEYERPPRLGDRITSKSYLKDVVEKQSKFGGGGRSIYQTYEAVYSDQNGEKVGLRNDTWIRIDREKTREKKKYGDVELAKWTPADIERFQNEYRAQKRTTQRRWRDVKVGDTLGPLLKGPLTPTAEISFESYFGIYLVGNKVAANLYDKHPSLMVPNEQGIPEPPQRVHWDNAFTKNLLGLPGAYDLGIERLSWMMQLVTDWVGDDGWLTRIECQYRKFNYMGDATWCRGKVTDKLEKNGKKRVALDLETVNHRDEVTTVARAEAELPD